MPQVFSFGSYKVYFWLNEGEPLEPVHVHVSKGKPSANSTKIWISSAGKCSVANNKSQIPVKTLDNIVRLIETQYMLVFSRWKETFGELRFYC
ncbi:MAG: DUF4160 domain-containing protein [Treponema sp.]|nr:DUF4160 domain-containing protein [Treponema sp.]